MSIHQYHGKMLGKQIGRVTRPINFLEVKSFRRVGFLKPQTLGLYVSEFSNTPTLDDTQGGASVGVDGSAQRKPKILRARLYAK